MPLLTPPRGHPATAYYEDFLARGDGPAALFIRVADRAVAARVLRAGGFEPVALKDGSFAIHAAEACGVTLVFG